MSHVAYDLQLADAMNDLQEQVKMEHLPSEKNEKGEEIIDTWAPDEVFQHLASIYVKYIDIYRKLEECYDQMVHPQKRIFIKKILESTICRICEVKKDLVIFNPRPESMYVHLDQLLFDLKYDPSIIEIPVPRYFREFDQIPIELTFKEPVEKGGAGKKKKKKKKAKKKKKKKAGDDDDEPKEPPKNLEEQFMAVDNTIKDAHSTLAPMKEIVTEPLMMELDNIHDAIRLIQKNERGRQGRNRVEMMVRRYLESQMKSQGKRDGKREPTKIERENEAALFIQRHIKGVLARKKIDELRQEEMIFLGMSRKPKTEPLQMLKGTMDERKQIQKSYMNEYLDAKQDIKQEIFDMEEDEIREQMLKERRDWIQDQKKQKGGKPPEDVKGFYDKPAEDEKDDGGDGDEPEEAKGKGKKEEPKGKGKGKKGAAANDDDDDGVQKVKIGPTEVVQKFDEFYEDYNNIWSNKDETENYQQHFDRGMAHDEMLPVVQDDLKKRVDEMLKIELENMRLIAGIKSKKKKKKGKKKGKKKKKKGPKLPGLTKAFWDIPMKTHLENLVKENIVRKLPERSINSFIGEFNYLHSMLDNIKDTPYDPSMALIRQLVTEYIIFPLGSELVRQRHPEIIKSFLFYGPPGSGKTHMVDAVATETNSIVLDLSPVVLERAKAYLGGGKKKDDELIATVMFVAKEYQPSIIYIDEAEKVWPAKKKGKKGKKAKKDPNAPQRIKKTLAKWKGKFIEDNFRITIIGCSSEPESCSKKEMKKFFDKTLYFPFPDYTTRRLMWKQFIEDLGGSLRHDFPLSTLAHISHGFSAGSIKKTCEQVLTKYRKTTIKQRPLMLQEFIGPLSLCSSTMQDQYQEFQKFTDFVTGDGARREKIEAALRGEEDGGGGKKDKKGKGKK